jgi:hypothetical protein
MPHGVRFKQKLDDLKHFRKVQSKNKLSLLIII